jgi:hypothetical protein
MHQEIGLVTNPKFSPTGFANLLSLDSFSVNLRTRSISAGLGLLLEHLLSLVDLEIKVNKSDIATQFSVSVGSLAIACAIASPITGK